MIDENHKVNIKEQIAFAIFDYEADGYERPGEQTCHDLADHIVASLEGNGVQGYLVVPDDAVLQLVAACDEAEKALYRMNGSDDLPGWVSGVIVNLRNAVAGVSDEEKSRT